MGELVSLVFTGAEVWAPPSGRRVEAKGLASLGVKAAWLVPGLSPRLISEAGGCGCRDHLLGRSRESKARRPWASGVFGQGASK